MRQEPIGIERITRAINFPNGGLVGLWTKAGAMTDFADLRAHVATAQDQKEAPTPTD